MHRCMTYNRRMDMATHLQNLRDFLPVFGLGGGHLQTLAGSFWPSPAWDLAAEQIVVPLADGDALAVHENLPPEWQPGDKAALLVHGLAGCHRSPYMIRIAAKLFGRGVRVFRLDLRGAGSGATLARLPYHAGRSEDVAAVVSMIAARCPGSPIVVAGFSLGGNIVLKWLGRDVAAAPSAVVRGIAVNPPIDLAACAQSLRSGFNWIYDRYFVRLLTAQLARRRQARPDVPPLVAARPLVRLADFDEFYTASVCGFGSCAAYYAAASAGPDLAAIRIPTHILADTHDPVVPIAPFKQAALSPQITLTITARGGHLGYVSRGGLTPDRRWMDAWVVERVLET